MSTFVIVKEDLKQLLIKSKAQEKENQLFMKRLRKQSKKDVDKKFHEQHEATFKGIDCLDCANCCKTTSPIFTDQDIKRLARLFKMKPTAFIAQYLRLDEEEDYVLLSSPCPFLQEDNTCFVYDVRPQACREYPHTNRKNMYQILNLTQTNSLICPAVADIVQHLKANVTKI